MFLRNVLIVASVLGLLIACTTKEGSADQGRTQEDCVNACWRLSSANCGDVGEECVDRCIRERVTPGTQCAQARQTYANCYWQTPAYVCDVRLGSYPTDCDAEFELLQKCLGTDLVDAASDAASLDAASDAASLDATFLDVARDAPLDASADGRL
ncbi:MAG TPA: hypothetical protein VL137_06285 [Polyangiaceae bacterium]|nr:hypothetical protein [Polyangiaceae bacterium]